MKRCTKCQTEKHEVEFSLRSDTGKLKSWCKACVNNKFREKYRVDKSYYAKRNEKSQKQFKDYVNRAKGKPCADCGKTFPYFVMEFDHRPEESKAFLISRVGWRIAKAKLDAEIEKCDVVCSNCHRIRTHIRKYGF